MAIFLSILRGINVSGQKMIKMAALKGLYEELGLKNSTTYIQSGNVVFEAELQHPQDLAKQIETKIFDTYSFHVPVVIRTVAEIETVLNENPFLKEKDIELDKLHVTFLAENATQNQLSKIAAFNYEPDRFIISCKTVYLYCPNGYGNTKLSNTFFESKLKVTATTRNWRTVNELFKIMQSYC